MAVAEIFVTFLRLALLFAGLLLPGAALLRALRLPRMLAGSFLGSAAILYTCVLVFALVHIPITLGSLTAGLAVATLGFAGWSRKRASDAESASGPEAPNFLTSLGAWTPLYAVFGAIIAWRLTTQPLNGGDVDFRWSWLAEQMASTGSLDYYPPRTAEDFMRYFWVESIPPGVAGLHAWTYACGASLREIWASADVLLQILALHDLVWRLAFGWGGLTAARRALLLACAVPILNWSLLLGQETGLTAIAVCGLAFGLVRWHEARSTRWLAFAAIAAVVGASTREYGLAFPALGLVLLVIMRAPLRALLSFAAMSLPLAVLWPLRTWMLTGNPFYTLGVGHLFPTHELFVEWAGTISAGSRRLLAQPSGWLEFGRYVVLFAPAATIGWLAVAASAIRRRPPALWCATCILVTAALWYASVPYTGGGLFYSLRVLSPAFAIGVAFGGFALGASTVLARFHRVVDVVLIALVVITLPFTLTLPHNPLRLPVAEWANAGQIFVNGSRQADADVRQALETLPDHNRILSECVSLPRSLAPARIAVVPLWSPEVSWLFDRNLPPADVGERWRQSGLRYVVMTRSPAQLEFLARRATWREPYFVIRRAWQSDGFLILDVTAPPAR